LSTARRILNTTAIQVVGKIITAIFALITIKYITGLESLPGLSGIPAEYKLIYTYLLFFGVVADFGLFTIGVREMSREPEEKTPFILGNIVGMRLFSTTTLMILAVAIIYLVNAENYTALVKNGVALAAITTIFTMMASTISSVLQVKLRMTLPTIALVIGKLISTAYIIYVVNNYRSMEAAFSHLIIAGIIGAFITYLITHTYTYRIIKFRPLFNFTYWKHIFYSSLPYGIAVILYTIYFKVDVLMLSFLSPKQEIAIYGFPSTIIEMLTIFAFYFMNSVLPSLSRAVKENTDRAIQIIKLSANFMYLMAAPIAIGGFILARPIITLIMDASFLSNTGSVGEYGADIAFRLIILSFFFSFLGILFAHVLVAKDEQKKLLKINIIGVLFNIISNMALIPTYGFRAAAITTIASEALILVLTLYCIKKLIPIQLDANTFFKTTLAASIMGIGIFYVQHFTHVILTITIGGLIYFSSLVFLRVISKKVVKDLGFTI
jgi:O-antigen/teichoic acid export membrane protein